MYDKFRSRSSDSIRQEATIGLWWKAEPALSAFGHLATFGKEEDKSDDRLTGQKWQPWESIPIQENEY